MSEYLTPSPIPEEEPPALAGMPKTADDLYRFRGTLDREPHRACWVQVFEKAGQTWVDVLSELPLAV